MKYSPRQYANTLYEILHGVSDQKKITGTVKNFISTVRKNNDSKKIGSIISRFDSVCDEKENRLRVDVSGGTDLNNLPKMIFGKHTKIKKTEAKINGVVFKVGDNIINNTLETRINRLKEIFAR